MLLETIKTFVNINKLPFFSGIIIKKEGDLHYIGGIRMNTTDRQSYINAITKLLEKADPRKLRLIWVYASRLIK